MAATGFKVGQLAQRTGVSIRALHYYDEIGLLSPSAHTESGHRLYLAEDVARLQQIKSLQQLGFSLEEIQRCLNDPDFSPLEIVNLHLNRLREQIELQQQLHSRLDALARQLQAAESVSVDDFLFTIERMTMIEKYYTPEQLEELKQRKELVGEERIKQVQEEWPKLMDEVRAEMAKGTDPSDEAVQKLARRWKGLIDEFTGGNPEIEKSLNNMYQNEPEMRAQQGVDPELFEYISKAMKSL